MKTTLKYSALGLAIVIAILWLLVIWGVLSIDEETFMKILATFLIVGAVVFFAIFLIQDDSEDAANDDGKKLVR